MEIVNLYDHKGNFKGENIGKEFTADVWKGKFRIPKEIQEEYEINKDTEWGFQHDYVLVKVLGKED